MGSKDALKSEALNDDIRFTYDGDDYVIERAALSDLDVLEAQEDGHMIVMIRAMLGRAQWMLFRLKHKQEQDLVDLSKILFEAVGASVGESKG